MVVDVGSINRKKQPKQTADGTVENGITYSEGLQQDRIVDYRYNFIIL